MTGIVFDIKRYAIHDGPGIRTTVFLKGCPLRCPWCQNPESLDTSPQLSLLPGYCIHCGECITACPEQGITLQNETYRTDRTSCTACGSCVEACPTGSRLIMGTSTSVQQLMDEINKDSVFYDESDGGVTFSGGEPLMQPAFLRACLQSCRQHGYHTAVDTSGHAPTDVLLQVAEHTSLFLYDLKIMDNSRHKELLGVSNETILENLRRLCENNHRVWLRFPVIPGINDDRENLADMTDFVKSLKTMPPLHLLPYHAIGNAKYDRLETPVKAEDIEPPSPNRIKEIADQLSTVGLNVKIGG